MVLYSLITYLLKKHQNKQTNNKKTKQTKKETNKPALLRFDSNVPILLGMSSASKVRRSDLQTLLEYMTLKITLKNQTKAEN